MMLSIRQALAAAAFGAAVATSPVSAQAPSDPPKPETPKPAAPVASADTEALKKTVDDLKADIKQLQTFRKDMEDAVYGKSDGKTLADAGLMKRLADLEAAIKRLDEKLTKIDGRMTELGKGTTSAYTPGTPGTTNPAPTNPTNKSTVRLINDYPVEMSMIVNGKSYRLNPGETRNVDVPPGSYTYELITAGSQPVTSTIKDAETVTLRIR